MTQACPECRTVNHVNVARCGSCGHRFTGTGARTTFDDRLILYVLMGVVVSLILVAAMWIRS
jgi:hypothetical protein